MCSIFFITRLTFQSTGVHQRINPCLQADTDADYKEFPFKSHKMEIYQKHFRCCSASETLTGPSELHLSQPGRRCDHVTCLLDSCTRDAIGPSRSHDSQFLCLCFAGERGDGGEAGGPVPPHCFQHGDAGLQEDPGESLSAGLEPQHVQHLLACADTQREALLVYRHKFTVFAAQPCLPPVCSSNMHISTRSQRPSPLPWPPLRRGVHLEQFFRSSSPGRPHKPQTSGLRPRQHPQLESPYDSSYVFSCCRCTRPRTGGRQIGRAHV